MEHKTEFQETMDKHGDFYAVHGEEVKQVNRTQIDGALSNIGHETLEAAEAIIFDGYSIVTIEPSNNLVYYFVFKPGKRPLTAIEDIRAIGWDESINDSQILATTKSMSYRYDNEISKDILERLEWLTESETELIETDLYNHIWKESQRGNAYPTAAVWNNYHILDGEQPTGDLLDPEPHPVYLPNVIYNFFTRLNSHNVYFIHFPEIAQKEPLPIDKLKIFNWIKDYPPGRMLKAGEEAQQAFKTGIEALKEAIDALYIDAQGDYLTAPKIILNEPTLQEKNEENAILKITQPVKGSVFIKPKTLTLNKNKVEVMPFIDERIKATENGTTVNVRTINSHPEITSYVHIGGNMTPTYTQLLIRDAIRTIQKAGNAYATPLQIAKLLYRGRKKLRSDSKFVTKIKEITQEMLNIPVRYDFTKELEYYASWKDKNPQSNSAENVKMRALKAKSKLFLERYDGDGIIVGSLINAQYRPVLLAENKRITDAFVFNDSPVDRKLDELYSIRNQFKDLPGLEDPLTPSHFNTGVFTYIIDKVSEFPYHYKNYNFFKTKQRYLEMKRHEETGTPWEEKARELVPIPGQATEFLEKMKAVEIKTKDSTRSISMDTLVDLLEREFTNINITRLNEAVQKTLDSLKKAEAISYYKINYKTDSKRGKKDRRSIQSYTVYFFLDSDDID